MDSFQIDERRVPTKNDQQRDAYLRSEEEAERKKLNEICRISSASQSRLIFIIIFARGESKKATPTADSNDNSDVNRNRSVAPTIHARLLCT